MELLKRAIIGFHEGRDSSMRVFAAFIDHTTPPEGRPAIDVSCLTLSNRSLYQMLIQILYELSSEKHTTMKCRTVVLSYSLPSDFG